MEYICARNKTRRKKARKIYIRKYLSYKKRKKVYFPKIDIEIVKDKIKRFSETLNFLSKKSFFSKLNTDNENVRIKIPTVFSVIENPDDVFSILKKILGYLEAGVKQIYFDYSDVTSLEIGAISLKNVICLNLRKKGIGLSGNFPGCYDLNEDGSVKEKYKNATEILIFSGIFKVLNFKREDYVNVNNKPLTLPLIGGGRNTVGITCEKVLLGKTEHDITQYFNKALGMNLNKELNENGLRLFDKIIGEVIANCQEHSGEFNQYFCSGHHVQLNENLGNYQLSIFNFGQTIYEGLKNSENIPDNVKDRMQTLISEHSRKFFGILPDWDEEALVTLFSLQNKISRVFEKGKQRGTGTVKMLQAFQEVGGCHYQDKIPKMTIISGNTQIIVDNSEICQLKDKQISFNKEKTLNEKPSKDYVKKIENYFPGTIISLNIFLDREWLEDKLKRD